jgi:putative aldouronate transport system substrate-binding protein
LEIKKKIEFGLLISFVFVFGIAAIWAGGKSEQTSGVIPGDKNPFGKYDPPITVRSSIQLSSGFNYERGDSIDNNPWIRKNHDVLGLNFKWSWVASLEDEYNQKMAASIASGDLPDIFAVKNAEQYAMLIRSGLIWDLLIFS